MMVRVVIGVRGEGGNGGDVVMVMVRVGEMTMVSGSVGGVDGGGDGGSVRDDGSVISKAMW
ncbi:unnamed protein product [Prunus brigantina]